ncbi:protein-disulfide reductase DsbD family protein [Sulfitobacter sp. F26204]|uniref:protein-disulfide reductase DsbD domain-containing protein n=1 Tax=Sulfitobacter sp. F26204 TaxID=2996014 RepID=UPI00225E47DE|nr:protein-disulfide reductase DsbD domain-containing protein [Sulfitobacter sp. F26204]MCX7558790.1 protein-disulfide reductase DsbD family protein [Sulfitobacter sp. F26204]
MIKRILTALAITCASALPLVAGDSFQTPVTGEILTGWKRSDGTRVAAVRLRLAPGWKTYWRSPGDAGIPPLFDWSKSDNLKGVAVSWPTPVVFLTAGMRTIGYSGDVILPLTLVPRDRDDPITLSAKLELGVCSDICVPHQMQLDAVLGDNNLTPSPKIAAALAARPFSAKEAGVKTATCALRPTRDGLSIEARLSVPHTGGEEVVIIEPGQPGLWASETKVTRQGITLVARGEIIAGSAAPLALDRSAIRITVLGSKHAVDIRGCTSG